MRELGAEALSDTELLAILISTGIKGNPAEKIAEKHLKLAELGRVCTQKVADWLEAGGPGKVRSIGKLRSMVREMLAEELGEIDELAEPLLHVSER